MKLKNSLPGHFVVALVLVVVMLAQSIPVFAIPKVVSNNLETQESGRQVKQLTEEQKSSKQALFNALSPAIKTEFEKRSGKKGIDAWQLAVGLVENYHILRPKAHLNPDEIMKYGIKEPLEDVVSDDVPSIVIHHRPQQQDRHGNEIGGFWGISPPAGVIQREMNPEDRANKWSQSYSWQWFGKGTISEYDDARKKVIGWFEENTDQLLAIVNCGNGGAGGLDVQPKIKITKAAKNLSNGNSVPTSTLRLATGNTAEVTIKVTNTGSVAFGEDEVVLTDKPDSGMNIMPGSLQSNIDYTGTIQDLLDQKIGLKIHKNFSPGEIWVVTYKVNFNVTITNPQESKEFWNLAEVRARGLLDQATVQFILIYRTSHGLTIDKQVLNPKTNKYQDELTGQDKLIRKWNAKTNAYDPLEAQYRVLLTNTGNAPLKMEHLIFTDTMPEETNLVDQSLQVKRSDLSAFNFQSEKNATDRSFIISFVQADNLVTPGETINFSYKLLIQKEYGSLVNTAKIKMEQLAKEDSARVEVFTESKPQPADNVSACDCTNPQFAFGTVGEYYPRASKADKVRLGTLFLGNKLDEYKDHQLIQKNYKDYSKELQKNDPAKNFWQITSITLKDNQGTDHTVLLHETFLKFLLESQSNITVRTQNGEKNVSYQLDFMLELKDKVQFVLLQYNICTGQFKLWWYKEGWHWKEFLLGAAVVGGIWAITAATGVSVTTLLKTPFKQIINTGRPFALSPGQNISSGGGNGFAGSFSLSGVPGRSLELDQSSQSGTSSTPASTPPPPPPAEGETGRAFREKQEKERLARQRALAKDN